MSAVLIPGSGVPVGGAKSRTRAKPAQVRASASKLPACVLLVLVLLEAAALFLPEALLLHPLQRSVAFKQISGYAMLALLSFAMALGWLRRRPALARHGARLGEIHQLAGLAIVVLLAAHLGPTPAGFLRAMFHAMALALGAGALRAVLGRRAGPAGGRALLGVHIGLCCLVLAGVLVHLYLVYAYTA